MSSDDKYRKISDNNPTAPGSNPALQTAGGPGRPGSNPAVPSLTSRSSSSGQLPSLGQRDARTAIVVPVRLRYQTFVEFVETQAMNISRSGMFIAGEPLAAGTTLDFELSLADGFPLLKGRGEVVRVSTRPPGMGVRFQQLDDASRKLIERIVEINAHEGKTPAVSLEFADPGQVGQLKNLTGATGVSPGVNFVDRDLHMQINPGTAAYFTNNPLLNIRLGGFVVPAQEDVPLGTVYNVTIRDLAGEMLFGGRGKVVAKHELRLGIRLTDVDKDTLSRLQAEVTKSSAAK